MISPVTLVTGILLIINTALAQHDGCGERMQSRALMIGGQYSERGMWPWQVGIYKKASNWEFQCGGALIAPQWVLTAAHCFNVKRVNPFKTWLEKDISPVHKYKVRAGDHETMSYESTEQDGIPLEILIHPGYKPNRNHENDIALIKLNLNFTLSRYVRTVCLPGTTEDLTKPGVTGTVAGWGLTESASHSSILRHSTHSILNNSLCHRGSKYFFNETVTFCAHDTKSMPCYGDSGGSMVRKVLVNGQHRWFTIGLVSWGGCTLKSNYGYYTRVQPFMDWILHKTNSKCLDPGPPHNGLRTPAKRIYQHNDVVTFGCKANYTRIGKALLLCQRDGTWDGHKPLCLDPCSDPGAPTHGVRFGNDFKHGQVVMFRCKQGYKLTGQPFIICNDGRWDKPIPNCSGPCSDPGIPFNGKRLDHSFHHNDKVRFSCDAGWKMDGEQTITCKNGRWNHNTPKCFLTKICEAPGDIAYGNKDSDRKYFKVGSTVSYWCFRGYERQGSSNIKCTKAGTWSASPPKCTLPTCQKPVIPQNARSSRKLKAKYKYNAVVAFMCEHGYFTVGGRIQRCLQQGKWSGSQLRCIPKSCGDPGTPKNGRRRGYVFTFKKKVYYGCSRGYIRLGPEFRQCHSNQKWSGDTPTCEPIDCMSLPTPQNGRKIEETKTTFQGRVTFECKKTGYELQGSATRVCQEDGKWDGTKTTCDPVECKAPGKPNKGGRKPDLNKYVYENKVTFECKTNHTLKGDSFIICQHDKSWTGDVPKCLAPCPDPGVPRGGYRHQHSFLHSEKVRFSCKNRWKMVGEKTLTCTDGKWDHDAPKCFDCGSPLGMESKVIPDANIKDSSHKDWYHHAKYGRLNHPRAWCSGREWRPYLEIDLGKPYRITYLATQGSERDINWVKEYIVGHTLARSSFVEYRENDKEKVFTGNKDATSIVRHKLKNPFIARKIRFYPYNPTGYFITPACMRVEIYGCDIPNAPCPDPGVPRGGYRHHHSFLHGEKVRFSCKNRWKMEGEKTLTCTDGKWDHDAPKCFDCGSPLGMESKKIPDANIKVSSHKDMDHNAKYGRLNHPRAWCSEKEWSPYLDIDLGKPYRITYLATQGSERDNRWEKRYIVSHTLARSSFVEYRENSREKMFTGNKDATSIVKHKLKNPFIARRIRFYPHNPTGYFITRACMRVEIYGCDIPNDCVMIGSRVLGKWGRTYRGVDKYYKAYVKTISGNDVQLDLENEDHDDRYFKNLPKTSIVLDVPPKQEELRKGTRVLAPWNKTYYPGRIMYKSSKHYRVKADDGDERWFIIDKLRRLKSETFCE